MSISGVELRDYFAGMALSGLAGSKLGFSDDQLAGAAYRYADAMMKRRALDIEMANMETPSVVEWIARTEGLKSVELG